MAFFGTRGIFRGDPGAYPDLTIGSLKAFNSKSFVCSSIGCDDTVAELLVLSGSFRLITGFWRLLATP
jgi:hypothetical protein